MKKIIEFAKKYPHVVVAIACAIIIAAIVSVLIVGDNKPEAAEDTNIEISHTVEPADEAFDETTETELVDIKDVEETEPVTEEIVEETEVETTARATEPAVTTAVETKPVETMANFEEDMTTTTAAPETKPADTSAYIYLTESEIRDFATLVYLEAGGESYECQKAVASVVLNRMTSSGKSLHEVIYAPGQFTPASLIPYRSPSASTLAAVREVVKYGPTLPVYVQYFRSSYYFSWATPYTAIDNTYFSYVG